MKGSFGKPTLLFRPTRTLRNETVRVCSGYDSSWRNDGQERHIWVLVLRVKHVRPEASPKRNFGHMKA
jgi:hypothetical protein